MLTPKEMYQETINDAPTEGDFCLTCGRDISKDKEITYFPPEDTLFCSVNGDRYECFDQYTIDEYSAGIDYIYDQHREEL